MGFVTTLGPKKYFKKIHSFTLGDTVKNGYEIMKIQAQKMKNPSGRYTEVLIFLQNGDVQRVASYNIKKQEIGDIKKHRNTFGQGSSWVTWEMV